MTLTTVNPALLDTQAQYTGFKNRIINGAMVIDQRNAGASVTANDNVFGVDRFQYAMTQSSKGTSQQSSTAPTGFNNSLLFTSSSAYAIAAGDIFAIRQKIEGFNAADLGWGTASAATITVSFWVRSSLTGTFGGSILNGAGNRAYPYTYTINAANTFEYKTITIAGDTTGTWAGATNAASITLAFGLGVGSTYSATAGAWGGGSFIFSATGATSVVGTSGATFYITGVQLEKGSTATSFDYRPYGTELALCQRYYYRSVATDSYTIFGTGFVTSSTATQIYSALPVTMRASPTLNFSTCRLGDGSYPTVTSVGTFRGGLNSWGSEVVASGGGLTTGRGCIIGASNSTSAYIDASAEL